jgi:cell wall assembly regulator SMI1
VRTAAPTVAAPKEGLVKDLWQRIETWLSSHGGNDIVAKLPQGASEEALDSIESEIGVPLPDDVKDFLRVHDGDGEQAIILCQTLLACTDIVGSWRILKELADDGDFDGERGDPDGPVKPDWWNARWIPLVYDGNSNYYCADLDPDEGGRPGQVVLFWHDDETRSVQAPSFQAWIEAFVGELEAGKFEVADGTLCEP